MVRIWTAVAKRSDDTAFRTTRSFQKRRGASLPAAVQNRWQGQRPHHVLSPGLVEIRLDTKEKTNNPFAVMANIPLLLTVA
jgi:hypothetical protein